MPFFGFIPTHELLNSIQTGHEKKNSSEPLYPLRDKTALLINDEIIGATILAPVHLFPASDKRDTAEKLAGYVKSTVAVLLKQLLKLPRSCKQWTHNSNKYLDQIKKQLWLKSMPNLNN